MEIYSDPWESMGLRKWPKQKKVFLLSKVKTKQNSSNKKNVQTWFCQAKKVSVRDLIDAFKGFNKNIKNKKSEEK